MIIQCQACLARFKLDPSRIKGKGARIRCRKCSEAIIVMKSDFPPPEASPPVDKDRFDLRAVFHEPEDKNAAPTRDEVDTAIAGIPPRGQETDPITTLRVEGPTPPTEREQEVLGRETTEPPAEQASALRDEVDASIVSSPLSEEETDQPTLPSEEEPPPPSVEKEAFDLRSVLYGPEEKSATPSQDEVDPSIESPLFREEDTDQAPTLPAEDPAPHAEGEREFSGQEPAEPSAQPTLPAGNQIDLAAETLLFQEKDTDQVPALPAEDPTPSLDFLDDPISLDLARGKELSFPKEQGIPSWVAQEAAGEENLTPAPPSGEKPTPGQESEEFYRLDTALPDFLRKMGSTAEPAKGRDISGHLRTAPSETSEEVTEPVPPAPDPPPQIPEPPPSRADSIQEELAGIAASTSGEEPLVAEPPPPEIPPPRPLEIERKQVTRPRTRVRSGKPSIAFLLLLFSVLAGGGAYLAFTNTGQETLRTIVPNLESFWLGGKETVPPYQVGNLIGYYENGNAGKMFIIKGVVTNQGQTAKSGIRIRAELLDVNQKTIAEKTAYAGNIITGLRSAARERIEAGMSNHFGDKLSNVDVAPGKSVSFMVVFFDSPEGIEEYRLEALDAE
jgi:predicted Zn finger-like uncharacterized protein